MWKADHAGADGCAREQVDGDGTPPPLALDAVAPREQEHERGGERVDEDGEHLPRQRARQRHALRRAEEVEVELAGEEEADQHPHEPE